MIDGFAGDFEFSGYDADAGSDPEPRRAWAAPELEELLPGTDRYERAVAAFREAAANRDSDQSEDGAAQG